MENNFSHVYVAHLYGVNLGRQTQGERAISRGELDLKLSGSNGPLNRSASVIILYDSYREEASYDAAAKDRILKWYQKKVSANVANNPQPQKEL